MKEAQEESELIGLSFVTRDIFDIGVHKIPEFNRVHEHIDYDVRFILKATDSNENIKMSNESLELKWFQEPPTDNPDINRMFKKWKDKVI